MKATQHNNGERGQVIVLLALLMIVLLGFAGLAIDGGNVLTQRRRAQNAADNAALSYALKRNQGQIDSTAATSMNTILSANGYVNGQANTSTSYSTTTTSTGGTVTLVLTSTVPTAFIHIVYNGPVQYTVQAQAQWITSNVPPMAGFALVGMSNCATVGGNTIDVTGGGNSGGINVHNGNLFVNSTETNSSNDCAIDPPTSANNTGITVDNGYSIVSVGGYNYAGVQNMTQPITTGYNNGVPITDPLAGLSEPTCASNGTSANGVYQPGNWNGNNLGAGTFQPGIYCITGDLTLSGQNAITANGVVLYFINGGMRFTGQAGITLSAPTSSNCLGTFPSTSASCTYQGMAIFVARTNTSTVEIRGNGGSAVTGTIYGVNATVQARGGGSDGSNVNCPNLPNNEETCIVGQVIAAHAYGNGNGSLDITYQEPMVYHPPPTIRLTK
jgi:Flp pilus assembly protein TadG